MSIFKKAALGALFVLTMWFFGFVLFTASALLAQPQGENETTDAIIVLTGGKNRVQEGLSLFAAGRASHLFISGVFEDVQKSEILALWDGDHALPPCCITLGYDSTTTIQNAQETRDWIEKEDYSSIRVVTGNYHMPRAMLELEHALPGIDIYEHPVKQPNLSVFTLRLWELLFLEYHKSIYRRFLLVFIPRKPLAENL